MATADSAPDPLRNRITPAFYLLALGLVVYVALCTGRRDLLGKADAWEHHRAVKALGQHLWRPGNPTLATDDPSVRYSPYTVLLAEIARASGADAYDVLSGAAVFNTALLMIGVALLLTGLGRGRAAAGAVVIMVGLYGGPPGYANSYALADLPWHQVNPSAFAFGWTLVAWGLFLRSIRTPRDGVRIALRVTVAALLVMAMLDHAMTGVAALIGLCVLAFSSTASREERRGVLAFVGATAIIVLVCCSAWPWYSFLKAVRWKHDTAYWFNRGILYLMLTRWCAPALLLSLFALGSEDRKTVRTLLTGLAVCLILGGAAILLKSATLARLPLPGIIFAHLALAVFADDTRLFSPRSWGPRIRDLARATPAAASRPASEIVLAIMVVGLLAPQVASVVREPYLARPIFEAMIGRHVPPRVSIRKRLDRLLAPVGERDVVLSDLETSWAVPSSRGRVVAALHYELFVLDQPQREKDLREFLAAAATDRDRSRILDKYGATWILIDGATVDPAAAAAIVDPRAVVGTEGSLTLLDARVWRADRRSPPPSSVSPPPMK